MASNLLCRTVESWAAFAALSLRIPPSSVLFTQENSQPMAVWQAVFMTKFQTNGRDAQSRTQMMQKCGCSYPMESRTALLMYSIRIKVRFRVQPLESHTAESDPSIFASSVHLFTVRWWDWTKGHERDSQALDHWATAQGHFYSFCFAIRSH